MSEAARSTNDEAGGPFEALADQHRRTIVELLGQREQSVQQLADQLPISRPAVSRHLRILKAAGLVVDRPHGTKRLYCLDNAGVEEVQRYLGAVWGEAIQRFTLFAENTAENTAEDQ